MGKVYKAVDASQRLKATNPDEAKAEVRERFRFRTLDGVEHGKKKRAPPGSVPEGAPTNRALTCFRGTKRAYVLTSGSGYYFQEWEWSE